VPIDTDIVKSTNVVSDLTIYEYETYGNFVDLRRLHISFTVCKCERCSVQEVDKPSTAKTPFQYLSDIKSVPLKTHIVSTFFRRRNCSVAMLLEHFLDSRSSPIEQNNSPSAIVTLLRPLHDQQSSPAIVRVET
jgi:hypothetical protein